MTTSQQAYRGTAAVRVAEISMSVLIGGVIAVVSFFLLTSVAAPVWFAPVVGALVAVVADIALRSFRRRYTEG